MNSNYWMSVLTVLNQSLYAQQIVCSMTSQLFHIPETKDLEGNKEMHREYLTPASYHRVTAVGSGYRLAQGEYQESLVTTLVSCVKKASEKDVGIMEGLYVMRDAASENYQPFIQQAIDWQQQADMTLKSVRQQLSQVGYDLNNQYQNEPHSY